MAPQLYFSLKTGIHTITQTLKRTQEDRKKQQQNVTDHTGDESVYVRNKALDLTRKQQGKEREINGQITGQLKGIVVIVLYKIYTAIKKSVISDHTVHSDI